MYETCGSHSFRRTNGGCEKSIKRSAFNRWVSIKHSYLSMYLTLYFIHYLVHPRGDHHLYIINNKHATKFKSHWVDLTSS